MFFMVMGQHGYLLPSISEIFNLKALHSEVNFSLLRFWTPEFHSKTLIKPFPPNSVGKWGVCALGVNILSNIDV